ncbi:MAG: amidase [Candidatus Limnocylindria bacterium]
MKGRGLTLAPLTQLRRMLLRREIGALELADAHLDRIAALDPRLNAFVRVDRAEVRRAARSADRRLARGSTAALLGVPIAIKDIFDERGLANTAGSALRLRAIARTDATAVARLRAAGAVFVGRTNLHEFAAGTTNDNTTFGQTRNPWDPARIPGGSSGGSAAAVSSGMAAAALGTDTAGSVRIPAACCGVVGLKPTYGRVSRAGVVPLAWSLDHVGPLARTVRDAAALLDAIAGYDALDPATSDAPTSRYERAVGRSVRGLRFSAGDAYFASALDPAVRAALRRAREICAAAGMMRVRTSIPGAATSGAVQFLVARPESSAAHEDEIRSPRAREIASDVRARLRLGLRISAVDYLQAQRARAALAAQVDEALRQADVLIIPTTAAAAIPIGADSERIAGRWRSEREILVRFCAPFNLSGHPSLALPAGFDRRGLPVSLQVVGPYFGEALVVRVAAMLERELALDLVPSLAEAPAAS